MEIELLPCGSTLMTNILYIKSDIPKVTLNLTFSLAELVKHQCLSLLTVSSVIGLNLRSICCVNVFVFRFIDTEKKNIILLDIF